MAVIVDIIGRDKLSSTLSKMGGVMKRFAQLSAAAAVATAGLAAKMAIDLEKGLREVGTLMGGLTTGQMDAMGAELRDLAAFSGQAMDKLVKAKYDIVSAGFADAASSAELLRASAKLAVAGVTEVSTSADLLTTAINAYGLAAEDATMVSDKLFTIVRLGKTTMSELGTSMGRLLAITAQAGISIDEAGAAIAALTASGQKTEEAVTAIRAATVQLLKPTQDLANFISDLGYQSGTALIEAEGFAGAIRLIKERADETNVPMTDLFTNVRAMQAVLPLTGTAADKFEESLREMGGSAGATQKAFEEMSASLSVQMAQARQSLNNVLIVIGNKLIPFIAKATELMKDFVSVPMSEKLSDESAEFNLLVDTLKDSNLLQDTRNKIIDELQSKYASYIGNLNLEAASIEDLAFAQEKANKRFEESIRLRAAEEILEEQAKKIAAAYKDLYEKELSLVQAEQDLSRVGEDIFVMGGNVAGIMEAKRKAVERARAEVDDLTIGYEDLKVAMANIDSVNVDKTFSKITVATNTLDDAIDLETVSWKELEAAMYDAGEQSNETTSKMQSDLGGMLKAWSQVTSAIGSIHSAMVAMRKKEIDDWLNKEITAVETSQRTEEEKAAAIELLKDEARRKEEKYLKKVKKIKVAEAISAGALAVLQALAVKMGPIAKAIYVTATAAQAAAQVAVVKSQPYMFGGTVRKMQFGGEVPITAHAGEMVSTQRAASQFGPEIMQMNQMAEGLTAMSPGGTSIYIYALDGADVERVIRNNPAKFSAGFRELVRGRYLTAGDMPK